MTPEEKLRDRLDRAYEMGAITRREYVDALSAIGETPEDFATPEDEDDNATTTR